MKVGVYLISIGALLGVLFCAPTPLAHAETERELLALYDGYDIRTRTYLKVKFYDPFALDDIVYLANEGIPNNAIMQHVNRTRSIYMLSEKAQRRLLDQGLNQALVDALAYTARLSSWSRGIRRERLRGLGAHLRLTRRTGRVSGCWNKLVPIDDLYGSVYFVVPSGVV